MGRFNHKMTEIDMLKLACRDQGFHVSPQYRQNGLRKQALSLKARKFLHGGRVGRYGDGCRFYITKKGLAHLAKIGWKPPTPEEKEAKNVKAQRRKTLRLADRENGFLVGPQQCYYQDLISIADQLFEDGLLTREEDQGGFRYRRDYV